MSSSILISPTDPMYSTSFSDIILSLTSSVLCALLFHLPLQAKFVYFDTLSIPLSHRGTEGLSRYDMATTWKEITKNPINSPMIIYEYIHKFIVSFYALSSSSPSSSSSSSSPLSFLPLSTLLDLLLLSLILISTASFFGSLRFRFPTSPLLLSLHNNFTNMSTQISFLCIGMSLCFVYSVEEYFGYQFHIDKTIASRQQKPSSVIPYGIHNESFLGIPLYHGLPPPLFLSTLLLGFFFFSFFFSLTSFFSPLFLFLYSHVMLIISILSIVYYTYCLQEEHRVSMAIVMIGIVVIVAGMSIMMGREKEIEERERVEKEKGKDKEKEEPDEKKKSDKKSSSPLPSPPLSFFDRPFSQKYLNAIDVFHYSLSLGLIFFYFGFKDLFEYQQNGETHSGNTM